MQKKYKIIYADPPLKYDFSKSDSRKIENQYPTMYLQEIKELNVPSEKNSICCRGQHEFLLVGTKGEISLETK